MSKNLFLALFLSLVLPILEAQNIQPIALSIPTSPQAEAIKKHGEFGVNYFTGIPDISIPLFEITHHGYKLPVSLKYYPQALKPGYNYDVFGHGWSISVNSCVSRVIKSIPDEMHDFKIDQQMQRESYELVKGGLFSNYNWEHDIFNVTLPDGSSFDMIIDRDYQGKLSYILSNGRSVMVECRYVPNGQITSFVIIDENGVKYTFSGADTPHIGAGDFFSYFVSWKLSRIDLPNAPDEPLTFGYDHQIDSNGTSFIESSLFLMHEYKSDDSAERSPFGTFETRRVDDGGNFAYKMKLLSSINYGSTSINFIFQNDTPAERNYVKNIQVSGSGGLDRNIEIKLEKSPFRFSGSAKTDSLALLRSINIKGFNMDQHVEKYSFGYLGSSFSFSGIDHWGYLNGYNVSDDIARMNMFLEFEASPYAIPITRLQKTPQDLCPYYKICLTRNTYLDNRQPGSPYSHGILYSITYPTGGHTEFGFTNNRCLTSTSEEGEYIRDKKKRRMIEAAGFRISSIENFTDNGALVSSDSFSYGPLEYAVYSADEHITPQSSSTYHTGVGEAVVDPNILTYTKFTSWGMPGSVPNMLLGLTPGGEYKSFTNPFDDLLLRAQKYDWECNISASNFRRLVDGRSSVVYPEVTIYHNEIRQNIPSCAKTVYRYDVYEPFERDTAFFEACRYYGNTLSYEPFGLRYNKLKEKLDYEATSGGYLLKQKESYEWAPLYSSICDYIFTNPYPLKEDFYPKWLTVGELFEPRSINIGVSLLSGKSTFIYDGTANIYTTHENYGYNKRMQLDYKVTKASRDNWIETIIDYPDMIYDSSSVIKKMVEKNIISPVVRSTTYAGEMVSGSKVDYAEYNAGNTTLFMPSKSFRLENKNAQMEYTLQDQVLSYSPHGNPLEFISNDGIHTACLWSYKDQYMIAMVKNVTYADVVAALLQTGISDINTQVVLSYSPDMSLIGQLREKLPNGLVTTFTHQPLVGITSSTDPRGFTTHYEYNPLGHLRRTYIIENGQQKTIQSYDYHYQGQ